MRITASNKMNKVHDNKLWLDEQEITKTDEMTGEEITEYTYIVISLDNEDITNEYELALANNDEFKAAREYKKREYAKQKNTWLSEAKAARPEYVKETYDEDREMTIDEKKEYDTDENSEPIVRADDFEYPMITETKEYDWITIVPEVPAVEEVIEEDGTIVTEGVEAIAEYEIRRPANYKTEVEWLCEYAVPVLTEPGTASEVTYITQNKYKELRANEYPALTELADAIVKGGDVLEAYKAKCLAVKAKYPKPEEA